VSSLIISLPMANFIDFQLYGHFIYLFFIFFAKYLFSVLQKKNHTGLEQHKGEKTMTDS